MKRPGNSPSTGCFVTNRPAQIARQSVAEPIKVLLEQWPVEPEVASDGVEHLRRDI